VPASVVCLSHATGAWGEQIGHLVAEGLGFGYVDEEILIAAAETEGLDREQLAALERRRTGLARLQVDIVTGGALGAILRSTIRRAIVDTAAGGNVVIVAHAASIALVDDDRCLRVLVTASPDVRAQRLAKAERLDPKEAQKWVADSDRGRAAYFKRFYGIERELPTHYDLVINTEQFSPERAAELVCSAAAGPAQ